MLCYAMDTGKHLVVIIVLVLSLKRVFTMCALCQGDGL